MTGLEYSFLLFLSPLLVAGLVPLIALRTYPRDREPPPERPSGLSRVRTGTTERPVAAPPLSWSPSTD